MSLESLTPSKESNRNRSVSEIVDSAIQTSNHEGLSLHELAERSHLIREGSISTSPVMSMIKSGRMKMPIDKLPYIAETLGIDICDLIYAYLKDSVYQAAMRSGEPDKHQHYSRTWSKFHSALKGTHNSREDQFLEVFRETQDQIGQEIEMDERFRKTLKKLILDYYAL